MTTIVRSALPPAGPPGGRVIPVSATLAANEAMAARRARGLAVLPLAFGEAGLPVHPALRDALAAAAAANSYGPVAGQAALRQAAAGYWARRGLPTSAGQVVCGPGSKPLLYALLLAIGGGLAVPRPSWVSYAAQAALAGIRLHWVPTAPGQGGIPDPGALAAAASAAAAAGQPIRSVIVTLPDNPTGQAASPATVTALCEVAAAHQLVIISDEIYRDLIHDPATPVLSPAQAAPERTVITTGASKNLALGGWRIGVARMPDGPFGRWLRRALLGVASEIWSAPAAPIQHAAALAFTEPPPITGRIAASRALHAQVAAAVAARCASAGLIRPSPAGRILRLPRLRTLARLPARPPPGHHLRRPGPPAPEPLRGRDPARQRVRRAPRRAAAAAGHRPALRRQPPAARSSAHRPRPHHPPLDRRRPHPAQPHTHRSRQPGTHRPGQPGPATPSSQTATHNSHQQRQQPADHAHLGRRRALARLGAGPPRRAAPEQNPVRRPPTAASHQRPGPIAYASALPAGFMLGTSKRTGRISKIPRRCSLRACKRFRGTLALELARCTIGPTDAGSRQCPLVIALLTTQKASRDSIGSQLKPTPTGQDAWRAASHSCDACSNACGHTARNQAASRMALTAPWTTLATEPAKRSYVRQSGVLTSPFMGVA